MSDEHGNTILASELKHEPSNLQFSEQKQDDRSQSRENTISLNMAHETLLLYNLSDHSNPVELAFQAKYGEIVSYFWFGGSLLLECLISIAPLILPLAPTDGYMMIGFSKGYVIAISTHMREIGEELQCVHTHEGTLLDMAYSQVVYKIASVGEDGLRVIDMNDWREQKQEHRTFSREEGVPERLDWSKDGTLLAVSTTTGYVFVFLMLTPNISCNNQQLVMRCDSLRSIQIVDAITDAHLGLQSRLCLSPNLSLSHYVPGSQRRSPTRTILFVSGSHCRQFFLGNSCPYRSALTHSLSVRLWNE